jgi:hypothetical protein
MSNVEKAPEDRGKKLPDGSTPSLSSEVEMALQETTGEETPVEGGFLQKVNVWLRKYALYSVMALIVGCIVLFVIALVTGYLAREAESISYWVAIMRDLCIIALVLEGILIGVALIALILQLATLVNALENEIKPIVDNTRQVADTMRGTAEFMSKHVAEPVILSKSFVAGAVSFVREIRRIRGVFGTKPETEDRTTPKHENIVPVEDVKSEEGA